jgi:hypothetical protein
MELPINNSVLVKYDQSTAEFDITRESVIKLLEPVIRRITMLPDFGQGFIVGIALRKPDAITDTDWFVQVAEMEPAVRIEPYFKPKQTLYKGL